MQETEKYIISFGGNQESGDINLIKEKWNEIASTLYKETGVFVDALVEVHEVLCNKGVGCINNRIRCTFITCVRNPVLAPTKETYQNTIFNIFKQMKSSLQMPFASMQTQLVGFAYFDPLA